MNIKWSYRFGCFLGHAKSQSKQKWYAFFSNSELWLFIRLFADFSQVQTESSQRSSLKRKSPLDEEEEEDSNDSFKLVSDNEEDVGTKEKVVVMFVLELDSYNVSRTENDKCIILYITNGFFDLSFSYSFVEFTL